MLFYYEVILIDGVFIVVLKCVGDGVVSGFESAI